MDDSKGNNPSVEKAFLRAAPEQESHLDNPVVDQSQKQEDEKCYIDCCCNSLGHVTRIWFQTRPSTFYLEYILNGFPGRTESTSSLPDESWSMFQFRRKLKHVKCYFVNLKNALLGRKQSFTGQAEWDPDEAWKVAQFINRKLQVPTEQR